jgi:hypothetical protein
MRSKAEDLQTFGGRLRAAMTERGKSIQDLQAVLRSPNKSELGVSDVAVRNALKDDSMFSGENMARAALYLGVEALWLAAGIGPRHRSTAAQLPEGYIAVPRDKLINAIALLAPEQGEVNEYRQIIIESACEKLGLGEGEAEGIIQMVVRRRAVSESKSETPPPTPAPAGPRKSAQSR